MYCEKCGAKLEDSAKFCGNCGAKVEKSETTQNAADAAKTAASFEQKTQTAIPNTPPVQTMPPYQQNSVHMPPVYPTQSLTDPLSVGQYLLMFLLFCIPIVNIILLFMWGFGSNVNLNKKNYARAALIISAIMLGLWIIGGSIIMGIIASIFSYY